MRILNIYPKPKSDEIAVLQFDNDLKIETTYELVLKFSLKKDTTLSQEVFEQVCLASEKALALRQSFTYLARRVHTQKELAQKLRKKGYSKEIIDPVLEELLSRGFIDEENFAELFIHSRKRKLVGKKRLNYELAQRGLAAETIENALDEAGLDDAAICLQAAEKKYKLLKNTPDKQKLRQKLSQHLARKGFSWEHISNAFNELGI